jgi:hypothetical protein
VKNKDISEYVNNDHSPYDKNIVLIILNSNNVFFDNKNKYIIICYIICKKKTVTLITHRNISYYGFRYKNSLCM